MLYIYSVLLFLFNERFVSKSSDEPVDARSIRNLNKMLLLTTVRKIINMDLIAFTFYENVVAQCPCIKKWGGGGSAALQ